MAESTNLENRNFLSPLNFKFELKRAPSINFFVQEANIPDISANSPKIPTPLVDYPTLPDQMKYDDLIITYKVDEALQNYMELYSWLTALSSPENEGGYESLSLQPEYTGNGLQSDISIFLLNSKKKAIFEIIYKDAFPIKVGGFKMNSTDESVQYVTASAIFKYTTYSIKPYN